MLSISSNLKAFSPILAVFTLCLPAIAHESRSVVVSGDRLHSGPFLGVWLSSDDDAKGVRVLGVVEGSGADSAGLKKGDVIVGIDGESVVESGDLGEALEGLEVGDRVSIELLRDGVAMTVDTELGEHRIGPLIGGIELPELKGLRERLRVLPRALGRHLGRPVLGVELVQATPELREHMGAAPDRGLLVGKVLDGYPAERAGIEVGDLIVAVDGEAVEHTGDLVHLLHERPGQRVQIDLVRNGRSTSVVVDLPEADDDEAHGPRA